MSEPEHAPPFPFKPIYDAPPPGETGTELTGVAACEAIQHAFTTVAAKLPKMRISPCDIDAFRDGRWIVVVVRFKVPARSFTVKLTKAWATVLWQRLSKVLGK